MAVSLAWQRLYINMGDNIMTNRIRITEAQMTLTAGLCLVPLSNTHEAHLSNFRDSQNVSINLLDFGIQFNGRPTMLMGGEDMYMPLFEPEEYEQANLGGVKASKNTVLIIAGGGKNEANEGSDGNNGD